MHHLALALATAAALAVIPCSVWYGSSATPPSATSPAATATGHRTMPGSTVEESTTTGIELPIGVRLPADGVLVGAPRAVEHDGQHSDWRARVRFPTTTASAALDSLERTLTAGGWQVERGSTDVFAVRQSGSRWELIQVLVDTSQPDRDQGSVIDVGIGSRRA
jgi:hypothetical protein